VVFFKKKINKIINKIMTALGEIDQKIRSGAGPVVPSAPTSADDQKIRSGAGPVDTTTSEGEEDAPDDMAAKLKKYAPYAIAAVVLYYFMLKK